MDIIEKLIEKPESSFWNAIDVYLKHPNSINKEILFSEIICQISLKSCPSEKECEELCAKLYDANCTESNAVQHGLLGMDVLKNYKPSACDEIVLCSSKVYFVLRKLLPKKTKFSNQNYYEVWFVDPNMNIVRFYTLYHKNKEEPGAVNSNQKFGCDAYAILKFKKLNISFRSKSLSIQYDTSLGEKSKNWINSVFIKKFAKLMASALTNCKSVNRIIVTNQINVINYYKLYEALKLKYAKFLIENWSENTDPQKFVFEDIGIAAYLLLLWNNGDLPDEHTQKQNFMDLGCGNGLLVYILNSEGHHGIGLDIRKRKIWDTYPNYVVLKEEAVVPGATSVYPDADWLIGNHSDELTPWLPIMARRSGTQCQYFVLPCCPFKLNGQVYQRKKSGLSTYHDFIQYVQGISEMCEFETWIDKLRIPSTKRVCIIGKKKSLTSEEILNINKRIDDFIDDENRNLSRKENCGSGDPEKKWIPDFKIRQSVEPVRNCTQLPRSLIQEFLQNISKTLLNQANFVEVLKDGELMAWNLGGNVTLRDLANLLPSEDLKKLKNECKGLQTLVKNHHNIFKVCDGGVRFRNPEEMESASKKILSDGKLKWKQKDCWFYGNHPDGCPLSEDVCSYKHEKREN